MYACVQPYVKTTLWFVIILVATIYQLLDFIKQFGKLKSPQLKTHSDLWLV